MNIIVLAKYSADSANIPPDAWDEKTGTLRRSVLTMQTNPLDDAAMTMACQIRREMGGTITVISMGPPAAEAACRRAIAFGADAALLLCDQAFAGADTIATSRTLAAAIRKIRSGKDSLILAGMQSPDGDTAQVPPQIAAMLDWPIVPYAASFRQQSGRCVFKCMLPVGRGEFELSSPPAVVTVAPAATMLSFHTTLESLAAAGDVKIPVLTAADLGLAASDVGLKGSMTRVVKIFTPPRRAKQRINIDLSAGAADDTKSLLAPLISRMEDCLSQKSSASSTQYAIQTAGDLPPHYSGDFMIICESEGDEISRASYELISQAAQLAPQAGAECTALLFHPPSNGQSAQLALAGIQQIIHIAAVDANRDPTTIADLASQVMSQYKPQAVLIPATMFGRIIAPIIAAKLSAGLTADCTRLSVEDWRDPSPGGRTWGKILVQTRPALGGNIMASIVSRHDKNSYSPQMATVRPGVFSRQAFAGRQAEIIEFKPKAASVASAIKSLGRCDVQLADDDADIASCDVLVSVGAGIGNATTVTQLARPLADAIAKRWGVKVGVACSRAAAESGYLPHSHQVGQTGKTVRPKIYIAVGISGAIQHRIGMENSGMIVAINRDGSAPIGEISDAMILGEIATAIPAMIAAIGK